MKAFKKLSQATFVGVLFSFGLNAFYAYIAPFLSSIGFSNSNISFIYTFSPLAVIVLTPILGRFSDEIGRKRIIILGLLSEIATILAIVILPLSFLRATILVTFQIAAAIVVELTILSSIEDNLDGKNRGFFTGVFESIKSLGVFLGPLAGSLIVVFYPVDFVFKFTILIFLFLIIFALLLKEKNISREPKYKDLNFIREIKNFWNNYRLRGLGILGIFIHFSVPSYIIFLPLFVIQDLRAPLQYVGFIAAIGVFFNLFQFIHGWLCDMKGSGKIVLLGTTITALTFIMIYFTNSLFLLFAVVFLHSFGSSMWNTSAWCYLSEIGEKVGREGEILGSYMAIAKIGSFLSFIVSGVLVLFLGVRFLFLFYGVLILVATVLTSKYFSVNKV